jgi:hypothetical protein
MEIIHTDVGAEIPGDIMDRDWNIYYNPRRTMKYTVRFARKEKFGLDMFPDFATSDFVGTGSTIGEAINNALEKIKSET